MWSILHSQEPRRRCPDNIASRRGPGTGRRAVRSLAHADPLGDAALLADHEAAPVEAAVTALAACLA